MGLLLRALTFIKFTFKGKVLRKIRDNNLFIMVNVFLKMVSLNFETGDYVKIRLALEEIEGRILECSETGIYLIKLNNGYNIGINKDNILAGRVLKKFKEEENKEINFGKKEGLPSVGMIVTGGTIASKVDGKTGGVKPIKDIADFNRNYPEMFNIVNVSKLEIPFMILSENMNSVHWKKIAEIAEKMLNDSSISGVIITHGTDTLHYTSAALSFFLRNLNKPVVLTYSQRSIDRGSSDANLNLECAAKMAISDCAEVIIVGHANINDEHCFAYRGTKVRKLHTSRRDAFNAINSKPLARITKDKVEFLEERRPRNNDQVELDFEYNDKVALVKYYPGQEASILDYYALKYKGIVIEGTGFGHVAGSEADNNWVGKLKKHIREGLVVCMTTQCIYGKTDGYVYSIGRELMEAGVIYLGDMLSETAFVKLSWILGHHGWKSHVKLKMFENFAGELNERLGLEKDEKTN